MMSRVTRSTLRTLAVAGAAIACSSTVAPLFTLGSAAIAAAAQEGRIEWSIDRLQRDGKVQLTIDSRWNANSHSTWSNDRAISELSGLGAGQVTGPRGPVSFALIREAGRLDCGGVAGNGRGSGACSFTPDAGFGSFLQSRGIGMPTARDAFSLTMSGVGRGLVDALDKGGFQRPDVDELAAMGIHGATADYVRSL